MKQILAKMIIVGDAEVGKTSLAYQYTTQVFSEQYLQTIGANFLLKENIYKKYNITLQIWDTAGQERFHRLMPTYYKGAHSAFIVFSLTDPASFENTQKWFELVKKYTADPVMLLVGNKVDLEDQRKITLERAEALAKRLGISYVEASAKTRENVDYAFTQIMEGLIQRHEK
ncbi:MAG: Rab family GTPase [Candidatus Ranarchaeia archaeon]